MAATPEPPPALTPESAQAGRPGRARRAVTRVLRAAALALLWATSSGLMFWAALAIYYTDLSSSRPRAVPAALFVVAAVAAIIFVRPRWYGAAALLLMFAAVLAWFFSRAPSNDRQWAPDVARLAEVERHGPDLVTIRNVRNFDYRSETDFTPLWEERTYDLDQLRSADLVLSYWGSKAIAHAMVSFGFADGRHLAVSIETRKERFESYSTVQGFFRQYELIYVFADERDLLRLRTNYRHEDVYVYRSRLSPAHARDAFVSYLDSAESLRRKPQWYNALTTNCATGVLPHARAAGGPGRWSTDILFSGYAARQAYRNHLLADDLPFEELERRSHVNAAAVAADRDPDFSRKIRAGLPDPWVPASRPPAVNPAPP
jgi:hypothetical protein